MIDIDAIQTKIIALAIQGKLTERIVENGTGEDLLQKILQTKKQKSEPQAIEYDDLPFSIPQTWTWTHIGDIFQHNTGKALNSSDSDGKFLEYITTSNLYWDRFELDNLKQMRFRNDELEKCTITKGDLLVCEGGDIGRSAIWEYDFDMRIQNHIHRLRGYLPNEICAKYYYYVMRLYKQIGLINGIGIGLQGFSSKRLDALIVPLPPFQEQLQIVDRLSELFTLLETISSLQKQYSVNISSLKSKIIDAAIKGKLTEQLPEDGTAEELFQQIQQGKAAMEKAGKIKKSKTLLPVSEEEVPFEIPDNWKWTRIGQIFTLQAGKNIPTGSIQEHKSVEYIYPCYGGNGMRGYVNQYNVSGFHALIGRQGALCGNINYADGRFYATEHAVVVYEYASTDMNWAGMMLEALKLNQYATSVAQPGLAVNKIDNVLIPLPPVAEQKRIVAKLEEILPLCE